MVPFCPYLMLYQTQNPHFFPFHTFTSISLPAANTNSLLASSSVEEMECVETGLETSLRKEMAPKSNPQAVSGDFLAINIQNGEDDFVNGFFDFSNDGGFHGEAEPQEKNANNSVAPKHDEQVGENDLEPIINFEDFGPLPGELVLPAHDVENLEWLSHFVEDSFKEYSTPIAGESSSVKGEEKVAETKPPVLTNTHVNAPVPAKARRSKRVRTGVRVWSVGSPASSDSSSSSSGSSGLSSPWLFYSNAGSFSSPQAIEKPKKKKKKSVTQMVPNGPGISGTELFFVRRCCHCGVLKTPQWRTGPLGAKSLCNACGVRYKSGRLLPEYRPACSPTFSSEKHSNHHRKVLEMRRKKGLPGQLEPGCDHVSVRIY